MTIPHEKRERILTKVQETVQGGYYAPDFHGKHWKDIVASPRQAILGATTAKDFEQEMKCDACGSGQEYPFAGPEQQDRGEECNQRQLSCCG